MADNNSVSLETLEDQRKNLGEAVSNLTAQRAQLEEQLAAVRNQLATNSGALQYANALIQSITGVDPAAAESPDNVVPLEKPAEEEEEVTL